jgi:hypothetical protein
LGVAVGGTSPFYSSYYIIREPTQPAHDEIECLDVLCGIHSTRVSVRGDFFKTAIFMEKLIFPPKKAVR